ncbi:MAG TPA: DUF6582 domain-containing protein [Chloroflexia bacterium]|nr:DUF6582 domain-containing protein [Chloroflexia bacterium]
MSTQEHKGSQRIEHRADTDPAAGERKYGDVEFADPVNKKYPIDTEEHVRAAWSYINHQDNAAKYDAHDVAQIKDRIRRAAKKHGVAIDAS